MPPRATLPVRWSAHAEDTVSILRKERRYEVHHGVKISTSALVAAATLSARYISDVCLTKPLDLVDEAVAWLKMEIPSAGRADEIDRKILQLEMERAVAAKKKATR